MKKSHVMLGLALFMLTSQDLLAARPKKPKTPKAKIVNASHPSLYDIGQPLILKRALYNDRVFG